MIHLVNNAATYFHVSLDNFGHGTAIVTAALLVLVSLATDGATVFAIGHFQQFLARQVIARQGLIQHHVVQQDILERVHIIAQVMHGARRKRQEGLIVGCEHGKGSACWNGRVQTTRLNDLTQRLESWCTTRHVLDTGATASAALIGTRRGGSRRRLYSGRFGHAARSTGRRTGSRCFVPTGSSMTASWFH